MHRVRPRYRSEYVSRNFQYPTFPVAAALPPPSSIGLPPDGTEMVDIRIIAPSKTSTIGAHLTSEPDETSIERWRPPWLCNRRIPKSHHIGVQESRGPRAIPLANYCRPGRTGAVEPCHLGTMCSMPLRSFWASSTSPATTAFVLSAVEPQYDCARFLHPWFLAQSLRPDLRRPGLAPRQ